MPRLKACWTAAWDQKRKNVASNEQIVLFWMVFKINRRLNKICYLNYRSNVSSPYTLKKLREPQHRIFVYRCFCILFNRLNFFVGDYLSVILTNIGVCLAVTSNTALIRFHSDLPPEPILVVSVILGFTTGFLFEGYYKLGELHALSGKVIRCWSRNVIWRDRGLMSKYTRSCQPIRVQLGSFGFYKKANSITIIGKIVLYTNRVLLLMKPRVAAGGGDMKWIFRNSIRKYPAPSEMTAENWNSSKLEDSS